MSRTSASAHAEVRDIEFPHLGGCIFLNAASFGPLPRRTRLAVEAMLRMREQDPARFAAVDFMAESARVRRAAASLVGASEAEIALAPGTSYGLYLAATLLPQWCRRVGRPLERSCIVVSDREFPANVLPWMGLRRRGVRVEIVPTDEHGFPREDAMLARLRAGDVALLAVSAVQFSTGYRADLARLGAACREAGALFVVDAIQALGATPIDVHACAVDVLACGGQKWLCAPHGSGFAYVRSELVGQLEPPLRGWLALRSDENFASLLDYDAPLHDDARRFEAGSPSLQDQVGLAESIEMLLEIGIDNVSAHVASVLAPLRDWAEASPRVRLASPSRGPHESAIVCVAFHEGDRVFRRLADAGVVCAMREGVIRFSPHIYNSKEEMVEVVRLLDGIA